MLTFENVFNQGIVFKFYSKDRSWNYFSNLAKPTKTGMGLLLIKDE